MKKTNPFILKKALNLHLSTAECLGQILMALICSCNACMWKFACCTNSAVKTSSTYRRFQRFFQRVRLDGVLLCKLILSSLGVKSQKFLLVYDRTNFKVGKKHINLLVLAVVHKKMAIPLAWKCLSGTQKQGNSTVEQRRDLLNTVIQAIGGKDNILAILGDREFLGKSWLESLQSAGIAYCVRLKENWQCIQKDQRNLPLIQLLKEQVDVAQDLGFLALGTNKPFITKITGKRLKKDEALMVAHSPNIQKADELYRVRWQIEHLFKSMKTSGFNFESTHLSTPERIDTLISCISIAFTAAYVEGLLHSNSQTTKIKKHGYTLKTFFRLGLENLRNRLMRSYSKTFKYLINLLLPPIPRSIPLPYQINHFFVV